MAESPYKRPVAADLIGKVLDDIERLYLAEPMLCGYTREMSIYMALKRAGYLTLEAQVPND